MLRRRRQVREEVFADGSPTARWLPRLREAGWVLPASLGRDDVVPTGTALGVVDGAVTSTVDPRGLVTVGPAGAGRSVDWWVGADDRWHLPAREPGVTQVRIEHAPVVETTVRVPGGEVVHRAYGARGGRYPGGDDWVVVEVENRCAVPVVLAWVIRPFTPTGLSPTQAMGMEPAAGVAPGVNGPQVVTVQGDPLALLARPPSRWARTLDEEDVAPVVLSGAARTGPVTATFGEGGDHPDRDRADLVTMALLVPLPHTATARLLLLPHGIEVATGWDDEGRTTVAWPGDLPPADAVARGWSTLVASGPRVDLPDPVLADAVEAARRSVVLAHRLRREGAVDDTHAPELTHLVTTRGGWDERPDPAGEQMEILAALARWGHHDAVDRALITWPEGQQRGGGFGSVAATAAALEALAAHAVAAGDAGPARAWLPEVGGAVEWLGRRARRPQGDDDPLVVADGLDAAAVVLAAVGQPEAAAAVAADAVRARARPRPAAAPPDLDAASVTPRAVAAAAVAATRAGEDASALWALLRRASSTWSWSDPERWEGDDLLVPARLLTAVGRLLVDDRPDGLALTTWMPPAWWGLGWEVHDVATRWGRLSYAVRWHSGRPALLWELGPPLEGVAGDVTLTAPGLDPSWSSTERRGEALLAAVPPPPGVDVGPEAHVGGVAVAAPPRSVWRPQDPGPDAPPPPGPVASPPTDEGGSFT